MNKDIESLVKVIREWSGTGCKNNKMVSGRNEDRDALRYELEVYADPLAIINGSRLSWLKKLVLTPFLPFIKYQIIFNKKLLEWLEQGK